MVRLVAAALAVVAFGALVGPDGSLTSGQRLIRESASILPRGTRIVSTEYRDHCLALLKLPSSPCYAVSFVLPGAPGRRANALRARAGRRWKVTTQISRYDGGYYLRFRRSDFNARATLASPRWIDWCKKQTIVRPTCADYIVVEAGPPVTISLKTAPQIDSIVGRSAKVLKKP